MRAHELAMEQIALLKPTARGTKGRQCPPGDVWLDIAAGFANQDSEKYLNHAAECDQCGPLLRQAKDDFADDLTPEESLKVASLPSANADWQRRLAQSLNTQGLDNAPEDTRPAPPPSWHGKRFSWKLPALATAAIALTVIAISVGTRLLHETSVDQLLATAYTERRTLEVRIPGAQHSPLRVERGATDSNLEKPASLLKAEALISEKLQKNPNDPTWLEARARADLLDGNYDSAVKTLLRARSASSDSAPLLTDLGSAYYMRGQSADRALDYGNAIEALGEALAKSPNDPIALFNRALACEQLFLYSQAVADWEHYLREDPDGEWAQEAREHLDTLKQKIEKRQQPHAGSLLPPEAHSPSFQRDPNLQTLAVVLQNDHDDTWLKNFLEAPPTPTRTAAIRDFQASDNALSSGRYGNAIDLAHQSMREFTIAQDQAGMLRAGLASMAAQDFALRFNDCLATVATLQPLLARTRYRWLQADTLIEQGQCLAGAAKLQQAMKVNQQGWDLAKRFHYPELQLRATAFGAGYLLDTGSTDQGLRGLRDGLATFWQSDVPDKRGENLYAALFHPSESIDWPFVDVFALKQRLAAFPPKDPVDLAVLRQLLANAQRRTGDYQAARLTLQTASAHLDALPNDRAVIMSKAEIAVVQRTNRSERKQREGCHHFPLSLSRSSRGRRPRTLSSRIFPDLRRSLPGTGNGSASPTLTRARPGSERNRTEKPATRVRKTSLEPRPNRSLPRSSPSRLETEDTIRSPGRVGVVQGRFPTLNQNRGSNRCGPPGKRHSHLLRSPQGLDHSLRSPRRKSSGSHPLTTPRPRPKRLPFPEPLL